MKNILLFLGTGPSTPIPREDKCPQCRSKDSRDKRLRTATLLNGEILIDAGPDILDQLKKAKIPPQKIKSVFLTHRHQDATGGLKALKKLNSQAQIYPPQPRHLQLDGLEVQAFRVPHGRVQTVGFLIGKKLAYISDTHDLAKALHYLKKAQIAVLDGSGWQKVFPSHQTMVEQIKSTKPLKNLEKIYFTHLGHSRFPHTKLVKMTQKLGDSRFHLAFDGLKINF